MGWIAIDRHLFEHWVWSEKPFSKGQAWIDLIGLANFKESKVTYNGKVVSCERGTVYRSISFLARRWGWSRDKTRRFLDALKSDNMITINATRHKTTITIENYSKYQDSPTTNKSTNRQRTSQRADNQQGKEITMINNVKQREQRESIGRTRFTPPTLDDVTAYCRERNNNIDPQHFLDYYQRQNWRLANGVHMADWKAAVRTWERRDKEQQQKQAERWGNDPDQRKEYGGEINWGC